ncbi:MAG: Maf family nucleotide pyrophosphatase [Flavicella sp.]
MLNKLIKKYDIILGSASPRRQQFLKDLHIPHRVQLFEVDEIYPEELKREQIPMYLSQLKAKPFESTLKVNELLITSDTIVWANEIALGKPKNAKEAFDTLRKLSGSVHEVITGVCLKSKTKEKIIHDTTKVYFTELTDDEINYYIENFKPYDKAGSYGIQEWIGYIGVEKIEGNYSNVMGLPLHKMYKTLKEF